MNPLMMPSPVEQQVLFVLHFQSLPLSDIRSLLPHDRTQAWVVEKLKCLEAKGYVKSRRLFHTRGTGVLHYYQTELGREFYAFVRKHNSKTIGATPGGLAAKT